MGHENGGSVMMLAGFSLILLVHHPELGSTTGAVTPSKRPTKGAQTVGLDVGASFSSGTCKKDPLP